MRSDDEKFVKVMSVVFWALIYAIKTATKHNNIECVESSTKAVEEFKAYLEEELET